MCVGFVGERSRQKIMAECSLEEIFQKMQCTIFLNLFCVFNLQLITKVRDFSQKHLKGI